MRAQIDTYEVKRRADLLTLASQFTNLEREAGSGGGEWKGPCPFCKGEDRFSVQPNHQPEPRWLCRSCTNGKWKDSIEFGRRLWPGLKFPEVCERLAGGQLPTGPAAIREPEPMPAATPPAEAWQARALEFIDQAERELWAPGGARALAYLHGRGLQDATIKHFRLGFVPDKDGRHEPAEAWGCPGGDDKPIYIDRGIVIPCIDRGRVWYVKIRRQDDKPKYRLVKGSKPVAIFNADMLDTCNLALMVEGEFDTMICWQEVGCIIPVATLGAAGYKPDLATWGRYFYGKTAVLLAYDNDEAGEAGAAALAELTSCATLAPLPAGAKDPNAYHLAGGDLREWIRGYLDFYDPLPEPETAWPMAEYAYKALGANVWDIPAGALVEWQPVSAADWR